jgi:hypothetical protein
MRCFRISADAILSVIFVQSAEIRWLNVIGHLYMSGLAMLSEILTEWVVSVAHKLTITTNLRYQVVTCLYQISYPQQKVLKSSLI